MVSSEISAGSPDESALITAGELAQLLRVSKRTLWRLRSSGAVPSPLRLGGNVRWSLDQIRKWIAAGCPTPEPGDNDQHRR
ncbi:MAG: helix-turn-helix domain-containing protein [Planctomycetaceae bacterium]|nr:helix-turn-helix domain-containing protein [Planctomycetaceae bacterium]